MDGDKQNSVNDDELNQMIANLQGGQAAQPPAPGVPPSTPPTPAPDPASGPTAPAPPMTNPNPDTAGTPPPPGPMQPPAPAVAPTMPTPPPATPAAAPHAPAPTSGLDEIKHEALNELRPLVNKLNLSPEDKFDTLLLIIRSTDDVSLLPAAHAAAKGIADETRRAQALLDVIKEIDFFGQQGK